jgi:hypothetical protein
VINLAMWRSGDVSRDMAMYLAIGDWPAANCQLYLQL